jgi:hypothetical protein
MSFVSRAVRLIAPLLLVAPVLAAQNAPSSAPAAASTIPAKLSDSAFWKLVTDFSEPNGFFQSDNFVSNETTFQWVIPPLLQSTKPGGAYLGVGPDQNFPYIIALKPRIAFIFDIRRQNLLAHLMYKALIEQSTDRVDFVSRLFSRPRPGGLDTTSTPDAIFLAYQGVPPDSSLFRRNLTSIMDRLRRVHGFTLSGEDTTGIEYVYRSFVVYGPDITYDSNRRVGYGRGRMPSYAQLQIEVDSDHVQRGYLATESNFRTLRQYQQDNLIIPLVGDFAGPKAIRSVGDYLKTNQVNVTAFYLSNVEQYLFNQNDDWKKFFNNVATLPADSTSTFIRSSFNSMSAPSAQFFASMMRSQQLRAPIVEQLRLFREGRILSYYDILNTSK